MKNLTLLLLLIIPFMTLKSQEGNEVSKRPEPLAKKNFKFPEYEQTMLDNGMKISLIKDTEQPTITVRLLIGGGSSQDGTKSGLSELTADMLMKGAGEMTAFDIASKVDGLGSSLYASSSNDFISISLTTLVKHLDELLPILKDVVRSPKFLDKELEKLKSQYKSVILAERGNPSSLASNLMKIAVFGKDHPYADVTSPEDIDALEVEDLQAYYSKYFTPNNISLSITGEFDNEIVQSIYNVFIDWEKGEELSIQVPEPKPELKGVYFISRPNSVQSAVRIITPLPHYNDKNREKVSLAASVMGASFTGRLFKTLREKYSYTYSPSAGISSNKFSNFFYTVSDVKTEVTDSSINVIMDELNDLRDNTITKEELDNIKNYKIGSYYMSFENSGFISNLIQNSEFKGVRAKSLETYTSRLENFTEDNIQKIVQKYMNTDDAYIIVVGDPSVKEKLSQYGEIYEYTNDMKPSFGKFAEYEKVKLDADDLLENYVEAIGGEDAIENVNSIVSTGKTLIDANGMSMEGDVIIHKKSPNLYHYRQQISSQIEEKWFDGTNATASMNGMKIPQGEINAEQKKEFEMFGISKMEDLGFELSVLGKKDGKIVLKAMLDGKETLHYFDAESFLLEKTSSTAETPNGPLNLTVSYSKYGDFSGIKLPTVVEYDLVQFQFTQVFDHEINADIEDSVFKNE